MRPKRKIETHLMEESSLQIVRELLPNYWTIREYKPDYGLDLAIETFEKNENHQGFDTLGEHFFVQLKAVQDIEFAELSIFKRNNIENESLKESELHKDIEIIKFTIDTNELATIHRMGNTIPVLLFVVNINTKKLYFLCLNDYIDKIILPKEPTFFDSEQQTKKIYIPASNEITKAERSLFPLMFYAKRPKFYSLFTKIGFQKNELNYCDESNLILRSQHYAKILLRFDIWNNSTWAITNEYRIQLNNIFTKGALWINFVEGFQPDETELEWEYGSSGQLYTQKQVLNYMHIHSLWEQMDKMKNVYESLCREWFLPTQFG